MNAPPRVTRVRKCRRLSVCGSCAGPINIGQREAMVYGTWMHTRCAIKLATPDPYLSAAPSGTSA